MIKNIVITGACGQIAYSLLLSLAQGALIKTRFNLKLLDVTANLGALEGLKMELIDTASPFINDIILTDDPSAAFKDGDYFFFLGAFPRGPGMERRDLLEKNGEIFIKQGDALNLAAPLAKVVVVGNPCNTNAYILHKKLKRDDVLVTSMAMLDQLRAVAYIAGHFKVSPDLINDVIIWGNHSKSLYVDTHYASFKDKNVFNELSMANLEMPLQSYTQKRGEEVIKARGKSSAGSAANAALEHMRALINPSSHFFSAGIYSKGNPYGIDEDLIFAMPCILTESGKLQLKKVDITSYKHLLEPSLKELKEERDIVLKMIKSS